MKATIQGRKQATLEALLEQINRTGKFHAWYGIGSCAAVASWYKYAYTLEEQHISINPSKYLVFTASKKYENLEQYYSSRSKSENFFIVNVNDITRIEQEENEPNTFYIYGNKAESELVQIRDY